MAKNFIAKEKTPKATDNIIEAAPKATPAKKHEKLDITAEPPKEYKFNARMPGLYGIYLNEKAYRNRTSITEIIQQLIADDMKKHPEILKDLKEINKYI